MWTTTNLEKVEAEPFMFRPCRVPMEQWQCWNSKWKLHQKANVQSVPAVRRLRTGSGGDGGLAKKWKPKSITDHLKLWARNLIAFPFVMLGIFPYMFLWCTFWLPLQDRPRTTYINESVIAMAWLVEERTELRNQHHANGGFMEAVRTYQLEDPDSIELYEMERSEKPDKHPNCTFIYLEEHGVQYAWDPRHQHLFGYRFELIIRSMLTFYSLLGWAGLNGLIYLLLSPEEDTDLVYSFVLPLCLAVVVQFVVGLAYYLYQHGCYFAGFTKELPKYTRTPWRPVCPQHGRKSAIVSQSAATANIIV